MDDKIKEKEQRYNETCEELRQLLTDVVTNGSMSPECSAKISQLRQEEQLLYEEIKSMKKEYSLEIDKELIVNILTDYGKSTLLKIEDSGNVTIGGENIPKLNFLAQMISFIAKNNEEESKIELTPEFIELISSSDIKLKAKNINLEGLVTANDNFKILEDGSIVANNGTFTGKIYIGNNGSVIDDSALSNGIRQGAKDGTLAVQKLETVDADIKNLKADKADITDLNATNAVIENLKANKADVQYLTANYATIKQLDATNANVTNLQANKANITDLNATNAEIENLKTNKADIATLNANVATINQALINKATVADLNAANAKIANLETGKADISVLEANYATIKQLNVTNANVTSLQTETANINKALIDKADVADLNATNANVTNLQATKANITDLNAAKANINTLTTNLAEITTLVNGNLTSDNIQSMVITGDKFTVADAFIKNAMIDSINASKINAGIINTNNVSIQSNDGSMVLQGNLQQFKDKNGKVRIQIGKDAKGNFTFCLYDENGTGQLINQNGIQSSNAIADGLIVDSKVAANANIAGSKLDIDSVVSEVNNGTTNIKGTKIYLDEQKQTLDVAFKNMSTTVSGNTSTINTHTTSINTMSGKVSQLISDTTIAQEDGTTVSLKDAYNSTVDTVDSHTQKIGSLTTNLATANNNISSVQSKQTALEQNLNGFKTTVSETYATKTDFNNLSIGGTNLQRYSKPYLLNGASPSDYWNTKSNATLTTISYNDIYNKELVYKLTLPQTATSDAWTELKPTYRKIYVETGKVYTLSLDYTTGDNCKGILINLYKDSDNNFLAKLYQENKSTVGGGRVEKHKEIVWTSTYTGNVLIDIYNLGVVTSTNGDSNLIFTNLKFERGNKATAWSPSPADIDAGIEAVDSKFANYSTTSAMNSAIEQKANSILSTVSSTYTTKADFNDLSIGGTNLLINSDWHKGKQSPWVINTSATIDTTNGRITLPSKSGGEVEVYQTVNIDKPNTKHTFSVYIYENNLEKGLRLYWRNYNSSTDEWSSWSYVVIPLNFTGWYAHTFTPTGSRVIVDVEAYYDTGGKAVLGCFKLEQGNKATAWSPNPLDIDSAITTVDGKFVNYSTTTQMNSAINQKANEITSSISETYATKAALNTVDGKFANYSTTSAMNSAINQKGDSILSTVSSTYTTKADFNNLSIGGTNLQRFSKPYLLRENAIYNIWDYGRGTVKVEQDAPFGENVYWLTYESEKDGNNWGNSWANLHSSYAKIKVTKDKVYTISLDALRGNNCKGFRIVLWNCTGDTDKYLVELFSKGTDLKDNVVTHLSKQWTSTITGSVYICIFNNGEITSGGSTSNVLFTNIKFEEGNKETTWNPAPQDIDSAINTVDGKFTNYSTTNQMNSAINQKANEITSSVSSTYATKAALNTVDGKFANYSTTTQMNSVINQKGDSILSTVSNTYTTKTDFNNLSVGSTNLQRFSSPYLMNGKDITNYWTSGRGNLTHALDGSLGGDCYWLSVTAGKIDCYAQLFSTYGHFDIKQGEKYSYSIDYSLGTNCAGIRVQLFNNGDTKNYLLFEDTKNVAGQTNKIHKEGTWTATWTGEAYVCIYNLGFINTANGASNLLFNNIKIEKGTFPTSWSPAPQDVNLSITEVDNKFTNYSTTSQMNSAINQKANEITSSVSSTYATKSSLSSTNSNVSALTTRMSTAESKLTKDSLTTTIGNYYTTSTDVNGLITAKGYATTSQVTQTATDLTAKFSSAGGYNMVRNGGFITGTNNWIDIGGGISRHGTLSTRCGIYVDTVLPKGFSGDWIKISNGKYYTFSAKVWVANTDLKMTYCTPLDWITNGTASGGHEGGYIGSYTFSHTTIPHGKWVDIWLTFKCTKDGYFRPQIKSESASDTMTMSVADIMITEGQVVLPWSPHPYETYDGITQIDKTGIKVMHNSIDSNSYSHMSPSAFRIVNKGTEIFKVDSNGLYLKGNADITGTITGSVITGGTIKGTEVTGGAFNVEGQLTANKVVCKDIDSPKYPGVVTEDLKLYVSTAGSDDSELEDGAVFASFDGILDKLPKNLNGHEVRIEMSTNITENVEFVGYHGGRIKVHMKGHTLNGYANSRMGSARIFFYSGYIGNSTDTSNGRGKIHPNKGYAVGNYTTSVACEDSGSISLYNIDDYGADNYLSGSSNKVGAVAATWGTIYISNVKYYGCDIGSRANAGGRVHDAESYGVCAKYGCQSSTGGYITLTKDPHAGGKTANYNESDAGKVIVASGATFATGDVTNPGGTAPVVGSKTVTIKSTSGDTYRSTVYNNYKDDNSVRQGNYGFGNCNGIWLFGDQFDQFKGKNITKVVITINRQGGGQNASVDLNIKTHNYKTKPSGNPSYVSTVGTLGLAANTSGSKTITDTNNAIITGMKAGTIKGIGLQAAYDSSHYAVCSGSVTIKVTYSE